MKKKFAVKKKCSEKSVKAGPFGFDSKESETTIRAADLDQSFIDDLMRLCPVAVQLAELYLKLSDFGVSTLTAEQAIEHGETTKLNLEEGA